MNIEILKPNHSHWLKLYKQLPPKLQDVFYHPMFAHISQNSVYANEEVLCATFNTDDQIIMYPFVKRNLKHINSEMKGMKDIVSLYGRGGILAHNVSEDNLHAFHNEFKSYCLDENIICGFDHFHPILENHKNASPLTKIIDVGKFVVVDLEPDIEDIEKNFKHMQRKSIKKAEKANVKICIEEDLNHIEEFIQIYHSTLSRREADSFYYFIHDFYEMMSQRMAGNYVLIYAKVEGKIVSAEFILKEGMYSHSYLGGTDADFLKYCPNSLLKRDIIRYLKEKGCRYFLLGGGQKPHDGIFNYKMCFAPNGVYSSYVGGTIYNEEIYLDLKKHFESTHPNYNMNRFQFYECV